MLETFILWNKTLKAELCKESSKLSNKRLTLFWENIDGNKKAMIHGLFQPTKAADIPTQKSRQLFRREVL